MKIKILSVCVFTLLLLGCDSVDSQRRVIDKYDLIENSESISNTERLQTQPVANSKLVLHDPEKPKIADIKEKWQSDDLSDSDMSDLSEATKNQSFANVAPILLEILIVKLSKQEEDVILFASGGEPDWRNKKYTMALRKKIMANRIWWHFLRSKQNDETANAILELMQKTENEDQKYKLIWAILFQWVPDAEMVLHSIAVNKKETMRIRCHAIYVLFERCAKHKYVSLSIGVVKESKELTDRCYYFYKIFRFVNLRLRLKKEDAVLVLETGFQLLVSLKETEYYNAHIIASYLGRFVKCENQFKPDQKDEKYQGEHGLNELFFTDTVRNALKWYEANKNNLLPD